MTNDGNGEPMSVCEGLGGAAEGGRGHLQGQHEGALCDHGVLVYPDCSAGDRNLRHVIK